MQFPIKTQLPKETQNELDRISAIASGARTTIEANFLTSLAPYLTNEIIEYDADGLITKAAGNTVPTSYSGFKKGALFIKKDATTNGLYSNIGDDTSATWTLLDEADTVRAGTPVNAVAATGVLTSNNTNVSNNDTVTIGGQTYTFKTTLTASTTANEVLIGADADGSLANLRAAINGTGTPGTDYGSLTAVNANVTCGAVTAHAVTLTAKVKGTAANSVATTEVAATLSFAQVTLTGGVDGTVGAIRELYADATYLYVAIAANTVADTNWRRISLGSAY